MKKTELEKGITLIALIITIIVLLILAVVTIGSVQKSNIIKHAQNAASEYKTKTDEENTILDGYLATIEGNLPGSDNDNESVPEGRIEYCKCITSSESTLIQKIEYNNSNTTATVKSYEKSNESGIYEYIASTIVTLENPIETSVQIPLYPDIYSENTMETINPGAIPCTVQGNIIGYLSEDKMYGISGNTEYFLIFDKVTDESQIEEIEQGIASIQ